jgi:hypothetical protein
VRERERETDERENKQGETVIERERNRERDMVREQHSIALPIAQGNSVLPQSSSLQ